MHKLSPRSLYLLLTGLTVWLGLQFLRLFMPTVQWYLGEFLKPVQLALFALATFALALLAPLFRRMFGDRVALAVSICGVALARVLLQVFQTPPAQLVLAVIGIGLFSWFLVVFQQSPRNRRFAGGFPILAAAFPLAFIVDSLTRTLLLTYDLAWRHGVWPVVFILLVAALILYLVWEMMHLPDQQEGAHESSALRSLGLVTIGPFLYLALAVTDNPSALSALIGWRDGAAHVIVSVCLLIGAPLCALVAEWSIKRRRWAGLLSGVILAASATMLVLSPREIWFVITAIVLWPAFGGILAATPRVLPLQPGLWRTALGVFLGLLLLLVIVFMVTQYNLQMAVAWGAWLMGALAVLYGLLPVEVELRNRSRATLTVVLPAIIAAIIVGIWAGALRAPKAAAAPLSGEPLRVMTYNIHQGVSAGMEPDLEEIVSAIQEQHPDVLGLNEVNRGRSGTGFTDTLLYISRKLDMPYVFGANSPDSQYGNAILSRYPIDSWANTHYVHNTTETRGLLRVVISLPGGPVTFYSTHLDHIGSPNNARAAQTAEALAIWNGAPRSVLMGDLNAEPEKSELSALYQAGLVDALRVTGNDRIFTFWDPTPTPGRRIDYIFVTSDLSPLKTWTVATRASDHLPVIAELSLAK